MIIPTMSSDNEFERTAERHTARGDTARQSSAPSARLRAPASRAALDAELLMAAAAGISRATLIAGGAEIDAAAAERFERMVTRREAREPLRISSAIAILFAGVRGAPGVLIPASRDRDRVEAALDFWRTRTPLACFCFRAVRELPSYRAATVLDIGTGSGAIAIAIAANAPGVRIVALDISKVSREVAADNARRHRCADRITFSRRRLLRAFEGGAPLDRSI